IAIAPRRGSLLYRACMLAPPNRGSLNRLHVDGTRVPVKEPSTASKADICGAANCSLFDHLVGAGEHGRWHREADGLRGLEIDNQFVFGRRLYRHVGWLFALKDPVDVTGRTTILVDEIGSIGDQAAAGNAVSVKVDRRKFVSGGKRNDQFSLSDYRRGRCRD